jgi:hypothetical protein
MFISGMFRNHRRRRMTQKGIEPRMGRIDTENDARDFLTTKYSKYSKGVNREFEGCLEPTEDAV